MANLADFFHDMFGSKDEKITPLKFESEETRAGDPENPLIWATRKVEYMRGSTLLSHTESVVPQDSDGRPLGSVGEVQVLRDGRRIHRDSMTKCVNNHPVPFTDIRPGGLCASCDNLRIAGKVGKGLAIGVGVLVAAPVVIAIGILAAGSSDETRK